MKFLKLALLIILCFEIGKTSGQSLTHIQLSGPTSVSLGSNATYNVTFWYNSQQQLPPSFADYSWNYTGGTGLFETSDQIQINFNSSGTFQVSYELVTFDQYFNQTRTVQVSSPCTGITASANKASVPRGRWGPCCSVAASGRTAMARPRSLPTLCRPVAPTRM